MKPVHKLTTFILMLVQLAGTLQLPAQDILLTKKGKEYKVDVQTVNDQMVMFKDYRQPLDDERQHAKKIQRLIAIKYKDGRIADVDGEIISSAEYEYRKTVALRDRYMNSGIPVLCWGSSFATIGFCMLGYSLYARAETAKNPQWHTSGPVLHLIGLIAFVPAIPMLAVGGYKTKRAIHFQKQLQSAKPTLGFNPILAPDVSAQSFQAGLSFRLSF